MTLSANMINIIIMMMVMMMMMIIIIIMTLAAAHILSLVRHCFSDSLKFERKIKTNERFTCGLCSAWRIGALLPISAKHLSCSHDLAQGF